MLHFPALPVHGDLHLQRLFWDEYLVLNVYLETCRLPVAVVSAGAKELFSSICQGEHSPGTYFSCGPNPSRRIGRKEK